MGNIASAITPTTIQPNESQNSSEPVKVEVDNSIDWSIVLQFLKYKEYDKAAEEMFREPKFKSPLCNMDNGSTIKDRLELVFRDQIFQSIVSKPIKLKEVTEFSILYSEIGGDKELILNFFIHQAEKSMKDIANEVEATSQKNNPTATVKNYPEILGHFLNQTNAHLLSYSFLEEVYDTQQFLKFIKNLQVPKKEPDFSSIQEHCIKYIQVFQSSRNLDSFLIAAKVGSFKNQKDALNLCSLLDEIVFVIHCIHSYRIFLRKQYEFGVNKLKTKGYVFSDKRENERTKELNINNYVVEPIGLYNTIDTLLSHYAILEKFYLSNGINTMMAVEEIPSHDQEAKTSPVISDIFILLFASLHRCFNLSESNVLKTIITHVASCCSIFAGTLKDRCMRVIPQSNISSSLTKKANNQKSRNSLFAIYLNDIDLCISYSEKLKRDCEQLALVSFKSIEEVKHVNENLNVFDSSAKLFSLTMKEIMSKFCPFLFQSVAHISRIFSRYDYKMNLQSYKEAQINDPWVENFCQELDIAIGAYDFSSGVLDGLLACLADYMTKELISIILSKKFSPHGGLQFARDLQVLQDHFNAKLSNKKSKNSKKIKFSKLNEVKEILNLERAIDILEYWNPQKFIKNGEEISSIRLDEDIATIQQNGEGVVWQKNGEEITLLSKNGDVIATWKQSEEHHDVTWQLTPEEVRNFLKCREDFTTEEINKLNLSKKSSSTNRY